MLPDGVCCDLPEHQHALRLTQALQHLAVPAGGSQCTGWGEAASRVRYRPSTQSEHGLLVVQPHTCIHKHAVKLNRAVSKGCKRVHVKLTAQTHSGCLASTGLRLSRTSSTACRNSSWWGSLALTLAKMPCSHATRTQCRKGGQRPGICLSWQLLPILATKPIAMCIMLPMVQRQAPSACQPVCCALLAARHAHLLLAQTTLAAGARPARTSTKADTSSLVAGVAHTSTGATAVAMSKYVVKIVDRL